MAMKVLHVVRIASAILIFLLVSRALVSADDGLLQLHRSFAHPPDDCRIMVRWWWFGPAVTKPEIRRELEQMKAAGIGGVEIATLYPLALDDAKAGFRNLLYLSDEHIEALRYAAAEARSLGLRVDVTLGSGWPFGGPHIPITEAAGAMRIEMVPVPAGAHSIAAPNLTAGEELIAAFLVPRGDGKLSFQDAKMFAGVQSAAMSAGRLPLSPAPSSAHTMVFFISSRTGMMVKRPAVGAEGLVLDHYDPAAIATHLRAVGDRLLSAFGDHPPYAVFSDSLENYGSNWTPQLMTEFRKRRGYDLTPHLPALIADVGPETPAIRHDWSRTLTELANEGFVMPLHAWAREHHTRLRSQTYGFPPVTLSSNRYEDLPEGEGKSSLLMWRQFSDTRWAASVGHLFFSQPVVSSETWTWLHSPAFQATPLDMKAEADLHFLQGINQLVAHGWPYSPASAGEPGWRMYAAGAFDAHNPWWFAMPDLTGYLQRVSYALRLGKPANDVALLLPNDDVWASFGIRANPSAPVTSTAGFNTVGETLSMDESMAKFLGDTVMPQILDSGFNLDFIDADAIDAGILKHPVLILPGVDRLPLATYRRIEEYAKHGGIVVATRRLPSTAPGFLNANRESEQIRQISQRLFRDSGAPGHFVSQDSELGAALATYLKPDVTISPRTSDIGIIHRKLADGDLYFIANTSNRRQQVQAHFRQAAKNAEWWDAFTGETSPVGDPDSIDLDLQPYESRLVFFHQSSPPAQAARSSSEGTIAKASSVAMDLSADWDVTFPGVKQTIHMAKLHSWSEIEGFEYYSGQAIYDRKMALSAEQLSSANRLRLDFGEGMPVALPDPLPQFNMRAYLEGPVREVAEIIVNGQRAGVVWHPPYTLDITKYLKPGENDLRIVVGNTAINSLAGQDLPDYRLLNDRFGERFVPQGMDHLQPLPSGILGPLRLVSGSSASGPK